MSSADRPQKVLYREAVQASVSAYAANEAAQRFYARHGFTPMTTTLRTVL